MPEGLLPLFPLKIVLFPRTEIPLHIFEERYKEMITECLQAGSEFGIVLVLEEGLASTGCTAQVSEVIRRFEDGRMDIIVRGERRFELSGLDQQRSYLRGEAVFFEDEPDGVLAADPRREQALQLYERLSEKLAGEESTEPIPPPDPDDPQLSFQIASRLPMDLVLRQSLLQIRSESERLHRVTAYLQKMALRLTRAASVQAKAGSNGKVR